MWGEASTDDLDQAFDQFGGLRSASEARLCDLIQEADIRQAWMADGARNLAEWIGLRMRIRPESASRLVRVARRLVDLPVLSEWFAAGDLSLDQVDAISRMATPGTEQSLVEEALGLSNSQLDRLARRAKPPTADDVAAAEGLRALWIQRRLDEAGGRLIAELPNASLEAVETRLRKRADEYPPDPETGVFDPYSRRMADALVEVCVTTGDETTSSLPQVTVYADLDALTTETEGVVELGSGNLVSNETARRLCCDSVVETIITDGSQVIGIGRNSRTVPGWLRRLVHHRDGGRCRFPGCKESRWLQVHHVIHWSLGGPTDLDNLILLCGFHHRFLHEQGWHITRGPDGAFIFRKPDWTIYPKPRTRLEPRLAALAGRPT